MPAAITPAALLPALRTQVDEPVGGLDDVEVVLDHDDGVAAVDQPVQHVEQPLDVGEVQAGRRLVEDVERPPGRGLGQLGGELDALRLAARERGRGLAEADVAQADVVQRLQASAIVGTFSKNSSASSTVMSSTSAMVLPLKWISSVSRL